METEEAKPLIVYSSETHEPIGYAMFVMQDGYSNRNALTMRKIFKSAELAQAYYDEAISTDKDPLVRHAS